MTKLNSNLRHHSARPPSAVKPNTLVNDKPNYIPPPETASLPTPNPSPSLAAVGLDAINSRVSNLDMVDDDCDPDDDPDCEDDDSDEDRSPKNLN